MNNPWQRLVPVYNKETHSRSFWFLAALSAVGFILAGLRMVSPLGRYSGMNDAYAWGVWKIFNVMTLTAIGSGGLAVGLAAWVFNRQKLHIAMRTALVTSFLFYSTGMMALMVDVGRPWNFWHIVLPWHWNAHSALLEVAVCMPAYAFLFLAFENVPLVLERFSYKGSDRVKAAIRRFDPILKKVYPFAIAGAYILPLMHQSSLGGLMLLSGGKVHPLWQSQALPLLYVLAACICGFAFVNWTLLFTCFRYRRPVSIEVVSEIGSLMSWVILVWLAVRIADIFVRGQLGAALALDRYSFLFFAETLFMAVPGVVLRFRRKRETPRTLINASALAGLGGLLYRFTPTAFAFTPAKAYSYFPTLPEVLMTIGFISFGVLAWRIAVRYFAILPGTLAEWDENRWEPLFVSRKGGVKNDSEGAPAWQESP
jgi:Ni/Fe-hydrogenase subunit HybB-like protein